MLHKISKAIGRRVCHYHSFTEEILLQWALPTNVVLECDVPVGAKGTGKHGDVTEYGFTGQKLKNVLTGCDDIPPYSGLSKMLEILYSKF